MRTRSSSRASKPSLRTAGKKKRIRSRLPSRRTRRRFRRNSIGECSFALGKVLFFFFFFLVLLLKMDGYSMWHELRVVLHNRENALLTQLVQAFVREERDYAENVVANWASLVQ